MNHNLRDAIAGPSGADTHMHPPNRPPTPYRPSIVAAGPVSEGAPVLIETDNYWLRSLSDFDAGPRMLSWFSDKEMLDGLNLPELNFTQESLRQFIGTFNNKTSYILGIFSKTEEVLIGFYTIDINLQHRTGQLTAGLGNKTFWGKDVMAETGLGIRDHFFVHRNLAKLSARILARNRRMLYTFIGSPDFVFEARLIKECLAQDGTRLDLLIFSAVKDDLPF